MPHTIDAVSNPEKPFRQMLLHNKTLHFILFTLLVIDGAICLTCGVLETQFLHGKSDDCVDYVTKCVPIQAHHRRLEDETWQDSFNSLLDSGRSRFLNTPAAGHGSTASTGIEGCGHVGQTEHFGNHDLHTAEVYLAYVSIGILGIFFIEQLLLIAELKSEYCKPMFVLDFCVILSSLVLEILVVGMAVTGLLVLARTWRFARVAHGMVAESEEMEIVTENDESFSKLSEVWAKLPDERWEAIAKRLTRTDLEATPLTKQEQEIVEELGNSPYVAMRAVAFSRMYQRHREKKKAAKAGGSVAMKEVMSKGNA